MTVSTSSMHFTTCSCEPLMVITGHMHTIPMRWCVLSHQEYAKCMDMKNAVDKVAKKLSMNVTFSCVNGTSAGDCMTKIKAGSADLVTLDGGDIKTAGIT